MTPVLKPEVNDTWLTVKFTSNLDQQLREYAQRNGVSRHRAARYILSLFLSGDWKKFPVRLNYEKDAGHD